MKNTGHQRGTVLRGIQSPETLANSPHLPSKSSSNKRRAKSDLENLPPIDYITRHDSKSLAKIRSPLPPRPPKRKCNFESALPFENSSPDSGVQVLVRMRPLNKDEEGEPIVQKVSSSSLSVLDQIFTFDSVSGAESTQQDIFQLVGIPLVENCLAGFNSSIFAYGQTGSGKTYTMWGPLSALTEDCSPNNQQGITPRVFERLFARIQEEQAKNKDKQLNYQCRCSFFEIYNEQITDLLDPNERNLQVREDIKSGVYVENLTEEYASTIKDVTQLLIRGLANRRVGATSINAESSRSHSVFTCVVESRCKSMADGVSSLRTSRINLVDLAGSERQKITGAAGERLKEAGNINRSLSQLGNLINILAEVSQSGKQRHIPYRDSRLTFLLQDSLGGNAKLIMICAISPAQSCKSETLSTLRFAQRAKAIQNKAVVNEITENDVNILREQIRQLKDELIRMKNGGGDCNGGYSTGWNARRSLNLLKMSLQRPMTLPHVEEDSDEEMEIVEEGEEKLCVQAAACEESLYSQSKGSFGGGNYGGHPGNEETTDAHMEDTQSAVMTLDQIDNKHGDSDSQVKHTEPKLTAEGSSTDRILIQPDCKLFNGGSSNKVSGDSVESTVADPPNSSTSSSNPGSTASLSIVPCQLSPVLESPNLCASPRVDDSGIRKSPRTSQKDLSENSKLGLQVNLSFALSVENNLVNGSPIRTSKNDMAPTESLAASLHQGMQIIDNHQQTSPLRRSPFRFSFRASDPKPIEKVDIGVQTLPEVSEDLEEFSAFVCNKCKGKTNLPECGEINDITELPLVPVDVSISTEGSKKQVPKAVEKVLAGAIRREMALEEFCAKKDAEIQQLNRLIQQYKHERECNAVIEQAREDKIFRLEGLMDGVLPTGEFMDDEFLSLANEHKLLKEKYENHPEVLRTNIKLKRLQDELDQYKNFFDLGERGVLLEEIQALRSQLQFYMDSSPMPTRKRSPPLLRLTNTSESVPFPLAPIPEPLEKEGLKEKFEKEKQRWTETECEWISLSEELRLELEMNRSLAEKRQIELNAEKKCSEELKEALQMAMQGHARILDQYAELQEKHISLLARHRKIRDGITDVKQAAAKAGVKGAESRFINSLAAEISALKVEMEKERQYLRDENKGLQSQLRDTAEAVQAAGELLVRLKEAEESVAIAQERTMISEKEAKRAFQEVEKLKKQHEREIEAMKQLLAESRLPESALSISTAYGNIDGEKGRPNRESQGWRDEFEPSCQDSEDEFLRTAGPSSWFSGYDRCNI